MLKIRTFEATDWLSVWPLLRDTFASGDTDAFSPDSTEADIHTAWIASPAATFVSCSDDGKVIGTYFIKPNQPGLGSHVCNCGYVVAPHARGQGIATLLCEHSQTQADALGFCAMQFNLVAATNVGAVRLWKKLGFVMVGRLPGDFTFGGQSL
jgi:ribosomal protein S18 acetylase RimI-like enzyme